MTEEVEVIFKHVHVHIYTYKHNIHRPSATQTLKSNESFRCKIQLIQLSATQQVPLTSYQINFVLDTWLRYLITSLFPRRVESRLEIQHTDSKKNWICIIWYISLGLSITACFSTWHQNILKPRQVSTYFIASNRVTRKKHYVMQLVRSLHVCVLRTTLIVAFWILIYIFRWLVLWDWVSLPTEQSVIFKVLFYFDIHPCCVTNGVTFYSNFSNISQHRSRKCV